MKDSKKKTKCVCADYTCDECGDFVVYHVFNRAQPICVYCGEKPTLKGFSCLELHDDDWVTLEDLSRKEKERFWDQLPSPLIESPDVV